MAEGKRPGGLTALAVLNFVWGGLGALGLIFAFVAVSSGKLVLGASDGKGHEMPAANVWYAMLLLGAVSSILLIASGVGYIQQKRVLGRGLGNAYAVFSLLGTAVGLVLLKNGFGITNMIGLVYPILTLFLLNTTFKDDLVN